MSTASYILGIVAALLVLVVVIEMLRRRRLRERHAAWWLLAGILALVVGVFPAILDWLARLVGVQVPSNLVFFVGIAILFLVCLQYAAELTRLESHTRTLAERLAIIEQRLDDGAGVSLDARATDPASLRPSLSSTDSSTDLVQDDPRPGSAKVEDDSL